MVSLLTIRTFRSALASFLRDADTTFWIANLVPAILDMNEKVLGNFDGRCEYIVKPCLKRSPETEQKTWLGRFLLCRKTIVVSVRSGSLKANAQRRASVISEEVQHFDGSAREFRGVIENGQLLFWSNEFDGSHVFGAGFVLGAFENADAGLEPKEVSHHLEID